MPNPATARRATGVRSVLDSGRGRTWPTPRIVPLGLDANFRIVVFRKLKLTKCARAGNRVGLF